jgi:DNA mismatch endonuclease, patch repair protein
MTDIVDSAKRSIMMAGIRSAHTRPELVVRKALHQRGFRYRLQARGLPGSPDIVLRRYNAVVFVHGCFWHRHTGCSKAATPTTRAAFWQAKFTANIERDKRNVAALSSLGWRVGIIWECATAAKSIEATVTALGNWLITDAETLALPPTKVG